MLFMEPEVLELLGKEIAVEEPLVLWEGLEAEPEPLLELERVLRE